MRRSIYLLMAMCMLAISCQKEIQTDDPNADVNGPFYLSLVSNTATTASFEGAIDLKLYDDCQEVGIIYSLDETLDAEIDSSCVKHITTIDKECGFSKKIVYLTHDTEYYYSGYVLLSNGLYQLGPVNKFKTSPVNFGVVNVDASLSKADIHGKIELPEEDLWNIEFGMVVSEDADFSTDIYHSYLDVELDGSYSARLEGLDINTTYHCCLFAQQGFKVTRSKDKTFMTDSASMTLYAKEINNTYVEFTGSVPLHQLEEEPDLQYGILISERADLDYDSNECERYRLNVDDNGEFTYTINSLNHSTKYYYCWYIRSRGKIQYGSVMSVTTAY